MFLKVLSLHRGKRNKLVPPAEDNLLEGVGSMVTCPISTNQLISSLQIRTCVAPLQMQQKLPSALLVISGSGKDLRVSSRSLEGARETGDMVPQETELLLLLEQLLRFFHTTNRIVSDFNPLAGLFLLCQFFHWTQSARNPLHSHSRMLGDTTGCIFHLRSRNLLLGSGLPQTFQRLF